MNKLITLLAALTISSWSFGQCNASFTSSQSPTGNMVVNFTNNSTPGPGANVTYIWNFDDGTVDYSTNPVHTYALNGTYLVCLTVIDSSGVGCSSTFCDSVVITNGSNGPCNVVSNVYENNGVIYGSHTSTATTNEWIVLDPNSNIVVNTYNNSFSHAALINGTYQVYLIGYDASGNFCDSTGNSIVINNTSSPCNASFSGFEDSTNLTTWYFNGSGSTGSTAMGGLNYAWDFGDGNTGSGVYPTHTYAAPGTYTVCLTISDSVCSDTYCSTITVQQGSGSGSNNCMADFWSVDSANYVYFINTSSGSNLNYFWDFGDGSTSSQMHPNHMYSAPGNYTVCLTVWDNSGSCIDTLCNVVTVSGMPTGCNADFVWFLDSAFASGSTNTVYIFNLSTGTNLSYYWDFGDGNFSTQAYPSHQYQQNGTYHVCLTINDGVSCSHTYCDSVSYTQRQEGFSINVLPLSSNNQLDVAENGLDINKLYPNPANDNITVEINNIHGNDITIVITDMTGRTVSNENLMGNTGTQSHNLNIGHLSKGMYNLTIKSENTQIVKRFIKQ